MIQIFDFDQGSDAWAQARCGIPTASRFADVLAKGEGKTRRKYLYELAGERICGEPAESFSNVHMDRGKAMEDEARDLYAMMKDVEPQRVGFIRNGDKGCSPDSLIGDRAGLEIKTALPHIQVDRLLRNDLPPEHKPQVQGSLWLSERDTWDFMSFWPKMRPLIVPVRRDEDYIRTLDTEVSRFNDELNDLVCRLNGDSDKLRDALKKSVLLAG